jgi:hypothetical protein
MAVAWGSYDEVVGAPGNRRAAVAGAALVVLVAWLGWAIPSQPRVITVRFDGPLVVKLEKP